MMLLFATLATLAAHADDTIFSKPAGKPIATLRFNPSPDHGSCYYEGGDSTCYNENGRRTGKFGRVTIIGGGGLAWGSEGGAQEALSLNVTALGKMWMDQRNGPGSRVHAADLDALAITEGRVSLQDLGGIPLYQMKLAATITGRVMGPPAMGGLYFAIEADSFHRFSRRLAHLGLAETVSFRVGQTGYVLVRYVLGFAGRGTIGAGDGAKAELREAIQNYQVPNTDNKPFPFGPFAPGSDTRENISHSASLILQLAKFAIKVDLTYANEETLRDQSDTATSDVEFAPRKLKRFDTLVSAVMPLALIFPNDSLQIEGRYVSLSFQGDAAHPDQSREAVDGSLGVFYGLTW